MRPAEGFDGKVVVFYDACCGMCSGIREALARVDLLGRVRWMPLQTPGAVEQVGLTEEQALTTVWAVRSDRTLVSGVEVVAAVLDALFPTAGVLTRAVQLPLLHAILEPMFHVVSENRRRLVACAVKPGQVFEPLTPEEAAWLRGCRGHRKPIASGAPRRGSLVRQFS